MIEPKHHQLTRVTYPKFLPVITFFCIFRGLFLMRNDMCLTEGGTILYALSGGLLFPMLFFHGCLSLLCVDSMLLRSSHKCHHAVMDVINIWVFSTSTIFSKPMTSSQSQGMSRNKAKTSKTEVLQLPSAIL